MSQKALKREIHVNALATQAIGKVVAAYDTVIADLQWANADESVINAVKAHRSHREDQIGSLIEEWNQLTKGLRCAVSRHSIQVRGM